MRVDDICVQARIDDLRQHGYIGHENGSWFLTEKGWRVLSAAAERPQSGPVKQSKEQIERELAELRNVRASLGRRIEG